MIKIKFCVHVNDFLKFQRGSTVSFYALHEVNVIGLVEIECNVDDIQTGPHPRDPHYAHLMVKRVNHLNPQP